MPAQPRAQRLRVTAPARRAATDIRSTGRPGSGPLLRPHIAHKPNGRRAPPVDIDIHQDRRAGRFAPKLDRQQKKANTLGGETPWLIHKPNQHRCCLR